MLLFRTVEKKDLEEVHQLALQSGVGITTLPKEESLLAERIAQSVQSIQRKVKHPHDEYYLFVAEDPITQTIVGTSAIEASLGAKSAFFNYRLAKRTRIAKQPNVRSDLTILHLVNDNQQKSELCTLYLQSDYRHSHHGDFLSRARFLFVAQHPERFESQMIAEMRGVSDQQGNSPFWEHVGQHFFHIPFEQADALTITTNKQCIVDLLPEYPLIVQLLHPKAQEVIGKTHPASIPAMRILMREGFQLTDTIDIFDAGPTLQAQKECIKTIQKSTAATFVGCDDSLDTSKMWMIATTQTAMRAACGLAQIAGDEVILNSAVAELLQVKRGASLRLAPLQG